MDAEDNALLVAIGRMMDEKLEPINARLDKVDTRLDGLEDGQARIDGKLAGLYQGQAELRTDMEKGFKETRETIAEVVEAVDKKIERLETAT